MNKFLLIVALLTVYSNIIFAKPSLTKGKYLIATLYDGATGTISPGNSTYQLAYFPDKDAETAIESDYWIIKNLGNDQYTFQNASTLKYIKYNSLAIDRTALVLVDSIQTDNSTSFTLELNITNNLCYYMIRSVVNTTKIWDRRLTAYESLYPIGVYSNTGTAGSNIQNFIFYDSQGNSVIDDGKATVALPTANRTLGSFSSYLNTLTFDGKTPVVDSLKKEFYLSIPESKMGTNLSMKINFSLKNSAYKLYVFNNELINGDYYSFTPNTDKLTIQIRNGATVISTGSLLFSCLPLLQIYSSTTIGAVYNLARIAVTEPDKTDTTEVILSDIKTRGAYSAMASILKKAYALKLKDIDGATSMNRTFFGLRSDNNWILDAMYIDPGRMRNRVSTDLWNDFSTRPYYAASEPKMINGTRGHFVEVFLNNSYNGLYCMTEKVDRKQLNLKKLKYSVDSTTVTQRGGLYKADDWSMATLMGSGNWDYGGKVNQPLPAYNNSSVTWSAHEAKYPDVDDGEPIEWKPLYDGIYVASYLSNDANFIANVSSKFDLPVFLDYYLFIELLLAADNQGKNTYLSVYDQSVSPMLSVSPWDLDATWGRRWDGSSNVTGANQNFDTFVNTYEHGQSNLYLRLKSLNYDSYTTKLKERYKQLRGNYFSYTNLMARFQNYCNLFNKSGAGAREKTRWSITDINTEMTFLSTWITARLSYLDKQYLGGAYVGITDLALNNIKFGPNPVVNILTVSNISYGEKIQIISLQGKVLIQTISNGNNAVLEMSGCAPGIYLIKAGGFISKIIKQ